ncbi:MAG: zinc-dependent metalloprotease [Firmicutes bacterium]|nr:zinc-dependent metalloprotease [Bacillota bacterium]
MKNRLTSLLLVLLLGAALFGAPAATTAQEPPQGETAAPRAPQRPGAREASQEPKPYEQVITKEAVSDPGVFTVHRIKDKLYYEIPPAELGREFLWVNQIKRTTPGVGYGGQALGNRIVRWTRNGNRILLRSVVYESVADPNHPVRQAVDAAQNETIIMAFDIEAFGPNGSMVIDVTPLFTTEVAELSARARLRARGFDRSRSFIERAVSFPENINVEATHTYTSPIDPPAGPQPPQPPSPFGAQGMRPGSATVLMHYSMVKLPQVPMKPRLYDPRVGFFSVRQLDYSREDRHRVVERRYITRWRLEKKDPHAELSEPVKPIVFYIDPATPPKWRPYLKRGVEKWQKAFEAAGFKNAILAKDPPSPQEDPDWSPEDARYSVIRWLPSTIENASGPHIHDPRTGEILEADIQFYHNVQKLVRDWYLVQAGPNDRRAQKLPMPDELIGVLLEYVTAHEVGHTLGFPHNMKASSTYPFEKLRDPQWLRTMGHTPTLMDYSRFNYLVQPEDGIDPALLVPEIGPYDIFAVMWGYKPIPEATTPDDEKKTLDAWARQQDEKPWLRFSTAGSGGSDPGELTEAVGDADAIAATRLGMANLRRVADLLLSATTEPGEPYEELEILYGRLLGQWALELNHVTALVGGFYSQQKHAGQGDGIRFTPVPRERQAAAVRYLNEAAFTTPRFLIRPEILRRIAPTGALEGLGRAQIRVLTSLLADARLQRLVEQEAVDGPAAYRPVDFLADVRRGLWSELEAPAPQVDAYRRNLQRAYLDLVNEKLNGRQPVNDDARALYRGELRALDRALAAAIPKTSDRTTRLHLQDARDQIARILDPKFIAQPTQGAPRSSLAEVVEPDEAALGCWPDYAVPIVRK